MLESSTVSNKTVLQHDGMFKGCGFIVHLAREVKCAESCIFEITKDEADQLQCTQKFSSLQKVIAAVQPHPSASQLICFHKYATSTVGQLPDGSKDRERKREKSVPKF